MKGGRNREKIVFCCYIVSTLRISPIMPIIPILTILTLVHFDPACEPDKTKRAVPAGERSPIPRPQSYRSSHFALDNIPGNCLE